MSLRNPNDDLPSDKGFGTVVEDDTDDIRTGGIEAPLRLASDLDRVTGQEVEWREQQRGNVALGTLDRHEALDSAHSYVARVRQTR